MSVRGYLIDTNILSEIMKDERKPAVIAWLEKEHEIKIPLPAIKEIEWGIYNRHRTAPAKALKLRRYLDLILERAASDIPAMTPAVMRLEAEMMERRELTDLWLPNRKGIRRRPPGQDIAIAAIAIEYHLAIATLDTKDFLRINAHFELPGVFNPDINWWTVPPVPPSRGRRAVIPTIESAGRLHEPTRAIFTLA